MFTRTSSTRKKWIRLILTLTVLVLMIGNAKGQTTQFTYQGKLGDNGNPANGNYDFEFKLFDTATVGTGTQQGSTFSVPNVPVSAGIFTVQLDFGAAVFAGADRFLEIAVKPTSGPTFTVLSPRQRVTSTPYAVRSATAASADTSTNATQLGGLTASGFIQNTTSQQAATSFNIGGTGTANILNATTQFNLNGNRVLMVSGGVLSPNSNTFVGVGAGNSSTTGDNNSFFGAGAGISNTTGFFNSFFGRNAGFSNTEGGFNSFFGRSAGEANTTGGSNSFFGDTAGLRNTTGGFNSFFGLSAGINNTTGSNNSFFGINAGRANTTGQFNAFFGNQAGNRNETASNDAFFGNQAGAVNTTGGNNSFFGDNAGNNNSTGDTNAFFGSAAGSANTTGRRNTAIGALAGFSANNLQFATAIGSGAVVSTSNTVVLGRSADGVQVPGALNATTLNVTGTFDANIVNATTQFNIGGIRVLSNAGNGNLFAGDAAGSSNTTGNSNAFFGDFAGNNNTTGFANSFFGNSAGSSNTTGANNTFVGHSAGTPNFATQVNNSTAIGSGALVSTNNTIVLGTSAETTRIPGKVVLGPVSGGAVAGGGGYMETFNVNGISGIFTGNLVFFGIDSILASPVHLCIRTTSLGATGGEALTRCTSPSSPSQYKTNMQPFLGGLDVINRLKPVTFKWKDGAGSDFGLNAEEVAEVEPLLITRNEKGEVEDVKEGSFNVLFINAFKEQQQEIETLKKRLQDFDALKSLVCVDHPAAAVCKSN